MSMNLVETHLSNIYFSQKYVGHFNLFWGFFYFYFFYHFLNLQ